MQRGLGFLSPIKTVADTQDQSGAARKGFLHIGYQVLSQIHVETHQASGHVLVTEQPVVINGAVCWHFIGPLSLKSPTPV